MNTDIVKANSNGLVSGIKSVDIELMEEICNEYAIDSMSAKENMNSFTAAFRIAEGIKQLHVAITARMMVPIMFLQGNQLGFATDKDKNNGYDEKTVKNCCVQAALMGAKLSGNEFNIISSKTYLTLNYFIRKVREMPGLTDFAPKLTLKSDDVKEGTTIDVGYNSSWKLDGKKMAISGTIPVRINKYMGADAALGKARRKMLALVVQEVQGSMHAMPEGDVSDCDIRQIGVSRERATIDVSATLGTATEETTAPGGTSESALKPKPAKKKAAAKKKVAKKKVEPVVEDDAPDMMAASTDGPPAQSLDVEPEETTKDMESQVLHAWTLRLNGMGVDADEEFVRMQIDNFCLNYWAKMSFDKVVEDKPGWLEHLLGFINGTGKKPVPEERFKYRLADARKSSVEQEEPSGVPNQEEEEDLPVRPQRSRRG